MESVIAKSKPGIQQLRLSQIDATDRTYAFRLPHPNQQLDLKKEIDMLGQLFPILVEDKGNGRFRIVDGFRRHAILAKSGKKTSHKQISCIILSPSELTEKEKFWRLFEKNFLGTRPYRISERALFLRAFYENGFPLNLLSKQTGLSHQDIEDLLDVAEAGPFLLRYLNYSNLQPAYAAMLARHYRAWSQTPFLKQANKIVRLLLKSAKHEDLTIKRWRFYLDFYWQEGRPSMIF